MAVRTVFLAPYHSSRCVDAFECQVEEQDWIDKMFTKDAKEIKVYRLVKCPSYCPHCNGEIHSIPSQEEMRDAFYAQEAEDV